MPQPVAEVVEALAVVGGKDPVFRIEIADVGHVLVQAELVVLPRLEHRGLERAEVAREGELAVVLEMLIGENQDRILCEGRADGGEAAEDRVLADLDMALVDDLYDFNRDGLVNATDQLLTRSGATTVATQLNLITVPGNAQLFSQPAAPP